VKTIFYSGQIAPAISLISSSDAEFYAMSSSGITTSHKLMAPP
jgi:hypothetical protein